MAAFKKRQSVEASAVVSGNENIAVPATTALPHVAVGSSTAPAVTRSRKTRACSHEKHLHVRPELLTSGVQYKQSHSLPRQEVTLTSFLRGGGGEGAHSPKLVAPEGQ